MKKWNEIIIAKKSVVTSSKMSEKGLRLGGFSWDSWDTGNCLGLDLSKPWHVCSLTIVHRTRSHVYSLILIIFLSIFTYTNYTKYILSILYILSIFTYTNYISQLYLNRIFWDNSPAHYIGHLLLLLLMFTCSVTSDS